MQKVVIALSLLCLMTLAGCGDVAHWHTRTFYGLDCREEKLVQGHCVAAR